MEIPKFHQTFNPILDILKDEKTITARELYNKVIVKYYNDLPKHLLELKTKSGDILINNRIAWGKSYLKKGGFIEFPKRGQVKITDKGLNQLNNNLSLKDVENSSNYLDFYKEEKSSDKFSNSFEKESSPQDLIDKGVLTIERQVKEELLDKLKNIDPFFFEKVILKLLKKMGYGDFIETSKTGDGGIDGIINEDKLGIDKIYIQAKRYTNNKVRETDIRNFIGAMSGDTHKGVFVTTSSFDENAKKKANDAHHKIILIDGVKLVDLMHEYEIGIQVQNTYLVKELDMDFFEGE